MHHIAVDGWAMEIIERELKVLYEGKELPSLKLQYADFSEWQKDKFKGDMLHKQKEYWKEILKGDLPILQLPTDRPRPPVLSHRGSTFSLNVPVDLVRRIKRVAANAGVSLFSCLFACFAVLLHKYSGQEDIIVGIPATNRNFPDLEDIVGLFVNTLPIRLNFSGEQTMSSLLQQTHESVLSANQHKDLPFDELLQSLNINRGAEVTPVFQAMFATVQYDAWTCNQGTHLFF